MMKKIPVSELRLGMHLHRLEGPWISHPFWKTQFVVSSPDDLHKLHASGVAACWIDTSRGVDVAGSGAPSPSAPTTAAPAAAAAPPQVAAAAPLPAPAPEREFAAELRQAAAICDRGREAVNAMFAEARLGRAVDSAGCLPLVDDIAGSVRRNPGALVSLARLKTRDDYSYMHSVAVCAMMVALARQIGMDEDGCRRAGLAGLMHDIGKALMPVELLNKPGRLTEAEFAVIRTHPERGHALLVEGRGADDATLDIALHHHERVDGTGYPHRLSGDALTQWARMGAICDVYDAVTSNRPYKSGWDPAESIAQMAGWKGHFDTALFAAFVQSLGIYPIGSLVRLESGRLAVVVEQNASKLVAPVVNVFYSTRSGLRCTPQRLDLAATGCSDRIVGRGSADAAAGFGSLDDLWLGPALQRKTKS